MSFDSQITFIFLFGFLEPGLIEYDASADILKILLRPYFLSWFRRSANPLRSRSRLAVSRLSRFVRWNRTAQRARRSPPSRLGEVPSRCSRIIFTTTLTSGLIGISFLLRWSAKLFILAYVIRCSQYAPIVQARYTHTHTHAHTSSHSPTLRSDPDLCVAPWSDE